LTGDNWEKMSDDGWRIIEDDNAVIQVVVIVVDVIYAGGGSSSSDFEEFCAFAVAECRALHVILDDARCAWSWEG